MDFASENRERYLSASPFPHIMIDDVLRPDVLEAVVGDFSAPDSQPWTAMIDKDQKKFATNEPANWRQACAVFCYS